jgi:hypothetical protein
MFGKKMIIETKLSKKALNFPEYGQKYWIGYKFILKHRILYLIKILETLIYIKYHVRYKLHQKAVLYKMKLLKVFVNLKTVMQLLKKIY